VALKIMKSGRAALESVRGTDLAPTRALYFDSAMHQQDVATIRPATLHGSYFAYLGASAGTELNSLEMNGALSFDDAVWLANTHIKAVASGTGGAADKTWTFLPTAGSDDIKSATIQLGYADGLGASQPAVKLNYCLGDELTISWDKSGDGTVSWASKMVVPMAATQISAFTGSAADRTLTLASCNTTVITIDTTTIGTTADNYWQDVSWTLTNGYANLFTLNNTTAAIATFRPGPRTWKLTGSRYYQSDTEWDAYIAKTVRKVRIKSTGPALGGSNYSFQLDLYGVYTGMTWDEKDDLGFQTFTLEGVYNVTATTDFSVTVVNADSAIT
jgi:hypothetical protein